MKQTICVACTFAVLALPAAALAAGGTAVVTDEFRITETVLVKDPPRFSVNFETEPFAPWATQMKLNTWSRMNCCEPIVFMHNGTADGGGTDYLAHTQGATLSYWRVMSNGFWNGATVHIYRPAAQGMNLVRTATVKQFVAGPETENRIYFSEPGPVVRRGDIYVLRMTRNDMPTQVNPAFRKNGYASYEGLVDAVGTVGWSIDTTTHAPEGGSTASLKAVLAGGSSGKPAGLWHWYLVNMTNWVKFYPGQPYVFEAWLKQEGIADGRVTVQVGNYTTRTLTVSNAWTKYEFDIPVDHPAKPVPPIAGQDARFLIGAESAGTLWIDNCIVRQKNVPPFDVNPPIRKAIADWKPQTLRIWSGLYCASLDAWLADGFAQLSDGGIKTMGGTTKLSLPAALKFCQDVGADPWLVINPFLTDDEYRKLIEYLAGPADTEYGAQRARHGRKEPWTAAFKTISLECANEAWNQIFAPRAWPMQHGLYGKLADRLFAAMASSPHFASSRFQFIANGWDGSVGRGSWTSGVALNSRLADRVDLACYFGGWEKGESGGSSDEVYQDKLFATATEHEVKRIKTLTADVTLSTKLGAALGGDPALASNILAAINIPATPQANRVASSDTVSAARAVATLFARDTAFADAVLKDLARLRDSADAPLRSAVRFAYGAYAPTRKKMADALGVTPDIARDLCDMMNDPSRGPQHVGELIKTHPDAAAALASRVKFDRRVMPAFEKAKADGTGDWAINNTLNAFILATIYADAAANGARDIGAGVIECVTFATVDQPLRTFAYSIDSVLRRIMSRRTGALISAMKRDQCFARQVFAAMAAGENLFDDAGRDAAAHIVRAAEQSFAAATPSNEYTKAPIMPLLTPAAKEKLKGFADEYLADEGNGLDPAKRTMMSSVHTALWGDMAVLKRLPENREFVSALSRGISDGIVDAIIDATAADGLLGEMLTQALTPLPRGAAKGFAVYEGGPGYTLPGAGKLPPDDDENMGKSLVMGVATLDVFMDAIARGYSPACYYNFKCGPYWASHSDPINMIPYPSWLALQLRNVYCAGNLVRVERTAGARIDVPDKVIFKTTNTGTAKSTVKGRRNVPLVMCWAFRDAKRYSIVMLNRSVSEQRPVRLQLPFAPRAAATLYALTAADPRTHNRFEANVRVKNITVNDVTREYTVLLRPASAYVLVCEEQ